MTLFAGTFFGPVHPSSPSKKSPTNNDGTNSWKGRLPKGSSPSGQRLHKLARITSKELAQILRVILGILQCVRMTNHKQAAGLARSVRSCTKTGRQPKRTEKGGGKGSVALVRNVKPLGCAFQDVEPPKVKSILRKCTKSSIPKRRVPLTPVALHSAKVRERNSSLGVVQPTHPHERSSHAPKFEERTQEHTLAKERWARSEAWDLARAVVQNQRKPESEQSDMLLTFGSLVSSCAIIN